MRVNRNLNISQIENFAFTLFDNKVSNQTYVGKLPKDLKTEFKDFVVVSCPSSINDLGGIGKGQLRVELFVRERTDGTKDAAKMNQLENNLMDVLDSADYRNSNYVLNRAYAFDEYDKDYQFYATIVFFNILIK